MNEIISDETFFRRDGDNIPEYLEDAAKTYVLNISEDENMVIGKGRKGRVPDVVVFGAATKKINTQKRCELPHFVIFRDGSVKQYVSLSDASEVFETSLLSTQKNYYASGRGIVAFRCDNAALYSVSVLFEGDGITDDQILSAALLLRFICLKILRIYGKKLPLDNNHIISAAAMPCGYECDFDTGIFTELCKLRPV
jgi:hypothetical protein